MRKLFAAIALSVMAWPLSAQESTATEKGVWLRPVFDEVKAAEQMDTVAKAGFNTVFVETFYHGFTVYPSSAAPQRPETVGKDILEAYVRAAKKRGLKIHAWLETFYWGVDAKRYPAIPQTPLFREHPEYKSLLKDGRDTSSQENGHILASPASPQVRGIITSMIKEILSRYEVDGIALDYLRYADGKEGAGYEMAEQFFADTWMKAGDLTDEPSDPQWQKWVEYREKYVLMMAKEARAAKEAVRPSATLGFAIFPSEKNARYESTRMQNWREMLRLGLPDALYPMCYNPEVKGVEKEVKLVLDARPDNSPVRIVPVLAPQSKRKSSVYQSEHPLVRKQLARLGKNGVHDFSVFCFDWIAAGEGWDLLKD